MEQGEQASESQNHRRDGEKHTARPCVPGEFLVEGEVADEDPEIEPVLVPVEGLRGGDSLHLGSEIAGADGVGWLASSDLDLPPVAVGGWSRIGRGWEQGPGNRIFNYLSSLQITSFQNPFLLWGV